MSSEASQGLQFGALTLQESYEAIARKLARDPGSTVFMVQRPSSSDLEFYYQGKSLSSRDPLHFLFALLAMGISCEAMLAPENPLLEQVQNMQKFIQEYQVADPSLQATMRLKLSENARPYKEALDQALTKKREADPVRALAAVFRKNPPADTFPSSWHSAKSATLSTIASATALLEKMKSPTKSPSASGFAHPNASGSGSSPLHSELDLSNLDSETSNTLTPSPTDAQFVIRGYLGFTQLLEKEFSEGIYILEPNTDSAEVREFTMGYQEKWQTPQTQRPSSALRVDYDFEFSESLFPFLEKTLHYFILTRKRLKNIEITEGNCRLTLNLTPDEKEKIDSALAQAEINLQKFHGNSPEMSSLTWTVLNESYQASSLRSSNARLLALETTTEIDVLCQKLDEYYLNDPPAYFLLSSLEGSVDEYITLGIAAQYLNLETELLADTAGMFGGSINTISLPLAAFPFFWNQLIPNSSDCYVSKVLTSHISEKNLHIQFKGLSEAELADLTNYLPIAEAALHCFREGGDPGPILAGASGTPATSPSGSQPS